VKEHISKQSYSQWYALAALLDHTPNGAMNYSQSQTLLAYINAQMMLQWGSLLHSGEIFTLRADEDYPLWVSLDSLSEPIRSLPSALQFNTYFRFEENMISLTAGAAEKLSDYGSLALKEIIEKCVPECLDLKVSTLAGLAAQLLGLEIVNNPYQWQDIIPRIPDKILKDHLLESWFYRS
jgi:hypothetical protein